LWNVTFRDDSFTISGWREAGTSGTFDLDQRTATLKLPEGPDAQLTLSGLHSGSHWRLSGQSGDLHVELKREKPPNRGVVTRRKPVGTAGRACSHDAVV
jgi:hypothetical protein